MEFWNLLKTFAAENKKAAITVCVVLAVIVLAAVTG